MSDDVKDVKEAGNGTTDTSEGTALLQKYKSSFFGSYSHTVDNKGRLVVPQSFREKLGSSFCIVPSQNFQSVAIYPTDKWVDFRESYESMGNKNPELNVYLEMLDALTYQDQECDGQGRVLLPAEIREQILKNEHDVKITGAKDHIRIVAAAGEKQRWESFTKSLPDILQVIGSLEHKNS